MTPDGFVEAMRGQLATQQVLGAVTNTAFSTSEDARAALEAYFGQREIQRMTFATADFAAKVNPGDADIEQYYHCLLYTSDAADE